MRFPRGLLLSLGLVLAVPASVAADAATALAIDQARYWEQRGRDDLAAEAWQKVLRIEPRNADALAGLSLAEIRAGHVERAAPYVDQLRAVNPAHPALKRLRDLGAISSGARPAEPSAPASLPVVARPDLAVAPPPTAPNAPAAPAPNSALDEQIEAARQLTFRLESRRRGLERLMALAQEPEGRDKVRPAWRQTLLWMNGKGGSARYFEAYLALYGEDATLRAKLDAAQAESVVDLALAPPSAAPVAGSATDTRKADLQRAWSMVEAGDLDGAEPIFAMLRQLNLRDAEALGGLATIRLRQELHDEALELFEQAAQLAPARWRADLIRVRTERELRLARAEVAAGNAAEAEARLRALVGGRGAASASKDPAVRLALAEVLVVQQRFAEAEQIYRDVLRKHAGNVDAARGMLGLLTQTERASDALGLYRTLSAEQQAEVGGLPTLQSLALRQQALAQKEPARAEKLLRESLAIDPLATWPRFDLARLYLAQGRRDDARSLIDGLPRSGPRAGEAAYIRALVAAEEQHWYDALMWMEQVPESQRNTEMAAQQQRLWVRYQIERAAVHARQGQRAKALALLAEAEPFARTPELIGALGSTLAESGETAQALQLLRQELARKVDPPVELQLAYAGLLLKLDQRVEFDAQIERLARRSGFSPAQQAELAELRTDSRLMQATALREAGDVARAQELLQSALRESPQDARLMLAIGRLYEVSGENDRARSLYLQALEREPGNVEAYQGMVRSCLVSGHEEEADRWMAEALRIEPNNGALYELAARLAKARGEDSRARQFTRKASELRPQAGGAAAGELGPRLQLLDSQLRPVKSSAERAALDALMPAQDVQRVLAARTAHGGSGA